MQMQTLENLENKFLTFRSSPTCGFLFSDIVIASPWKNSTFLFAVLDALIGRFFRSDISAETLWVGGWLLRQLLSYNVEDSSRHHPELLKELHKNYINCLLGEVTEIRCDVLIAAVIDAWKKCKTGESSSFSGKKNVQDSQGYAGFYWIIYFYDSVKMHTHRSIGPATIW